MNKLKRFFWDSIVPNLPKVRDPLLWWGILWRGGPSRQRYHVGWVKTEKIVELKQHLLDRCGFEMCRLGWLDKGEVCALRKKAGNTHQYHLRIFEDGEVRGHFEFMPEFRAWDHFLERGHEPRSEAFLAFVQFHLSQSKKLGANGKFSAPKKA